MITILLRSPEQPALNRAQMQRVAKAARAHAEYQKLREHPSYDSDDDSGPEDEDAWLYEDLGILLRMHGKLRDKEQLIELILEVRRLHFVWFCNWPDERSELHGGAAQGHHHDILYPIGPSIQSR